MTEVLDMEESDLSFASILLGFRQAGDSSHVDLKMVQNTQGNKEMLNYMGNTVYEDCSAVPYANSISSVCYQQSEIHDMAAIKSKEGKLHIDKQGSEHSEESVNLRDEMDRRVIYDRNFTDQQLQKLARGRYKCSRCGALKTNHDCPMVEQLEGSSSTQVEKIILTADEFHGYTSKTDYNPSNNGSSTFDDVNRSRPVRTITVRAHPYTFSSPSISYNASYSASANRTVSTGFYDGNNDNRKKNAYINNNNNNNNSNNNNNNNKNGQYNSHSNSHQNGNNYSNGHNNILHNNNNNNHNHINNNTKNNNLNNNHSNSNYNLNNINNHNNHNSNSNNNSNSNLNYINSSNSTNKAVINNSNSSSNSINNNNTLINNNNNNNSSNKHNLNNNNNTLINNNNINNLNSNNNNSNNNNNHTYKYSGNDLDNAQKRMKYEVI